MHNSKVIIEITFVFVYKFEKNIFIFRFTKTINSFIRSFLFSKIYHPVTFHYIYTVKRIGMDVLYSSVVFDSFTYYNLIVNQYSVGKFLT